MPDADELRVAFNLYFASTRFDPAFGLGLVLGLCAPDAHRGRTLKSRRISD